MPQLPKVQPSLELVLRYLERALNPLSYKMDNSAVGWVGIKPTPQKQGVQGYVFMLGCQKRQPNLRCYDAYI
jgi:hypothetical protein